MFNKPIGFYASLAEIISAIVIVITLMYGVIEYNSEQAVDISEIDTVLYNRSAERNLLIANNVDLATTVLKAENNPQALTETEKYQYLILRLNYFNDWETAFFYHQEGRMDEDTWLMWNKAYAKDAMIFPNFAWELNRHNFPNTDFTDHVDLVLSNRPSDE